MATTTWKQRFIPLGLGAAMLGTLIAAALSPNIGAVPAAVNAQYGTPAGTSTPFPWWIVGVVVALVAALVLAYLIVGRRRRPPAAAAAPPETAEPPAGASAGAPPSMGASHPYIETPEDVGVAVPTMAVAPPAAAAATPPATGAEEEPDIDALMAELDKISGEILKKPPKGGTGGSTSDADAGTGTGK